MAEAQTAVQSGQLTKKEALDAVKQGKQPPLLGMYQALAADQALNVYKQAPPDERQQIQKTLLVKLQAYAKQHGTNNTVLDKARKLGVVRSRRGCYSSRA